MAGSRGGRPQKFGEPTVVRQFRLAESLNERLTKYAREEGLDVSDVVRTAIDNFLSGSHQEALKAEWEEEKRQALEIIREMNRSLSQFSEVKKAGSELQGKPTSNEVETELENNASVSSNKQ